MSIVVNRTNCYTYINICVYIYYINVCSTYKSECKNVFFFCLIDPRNAIIEQAILIALRDVDRLIARYSLRYI